jgi:outer membrane protein assembly factor BamB
VATAGEKLIALGEQTTPLWQLDLPHGPLAGIAAASENVLLAASRSGMVWALKADTGEAIGSPIDVGQPLAGPPVIASGRIIVAGADGSLQLLVKSAGEFR